MKLDHKTHEALDLSSLATIPRYATFRRIMGVPPEQRTQQHLSNLAEIIKYMKFVKDFKLDAPRRKMLCHNMRLRSYRCVVCVLAICVPRPGCSLRCATVRVAYKTIFHQGDAGRAFFVVAVGRVSIQVLDETRGVLKV